MWTEEVEIRKRKKFLAVGETRLATNSYILTYSGFKGRTFVSSGFSTNGTLVSTPAVPHRGLAGRNQAKWNDSKPVYSLKTTPSTKHTASKDVKFEV